MFMFQDFSPCGGKSLRPFLPNLYLLWPKAIRQSTFPSPEPDLQSGSFSGQSTVDFPPPGKTGKLAVVPPKCFRGHSRQFHDCRAEFNSIFSPSLAPLQGC